MKKTLAVLAASALCLLVAAATVSALGSAKPKLKPAGPNGIGAVKIGATAKSLQNKGLIGNLSKGCPLVPGQRTASLSRPLRGSVTFAPGESRVSNISSTIGWETGAGVHPGMSVQKALKAYPKHTYISAKNNPTFGLGFLYVPTRKNAKMAFIVDPTKQAVVQIAIPTILLCE